MGPMKRLGRSRRIARLDLQIVHLGVLKRDLTLVVSVAKFGMLRREAEFRSVSTVPKSSGPRLIITDRRGVGLDSRLPENAALPPDGLTAHATRHARKCRCDRPRIRRAACGARFHDMKRGQHGMAYQGCQGGASQHHQVGSAYGYRHQLARDRLKLA